MRERTIDPSRNNPSTIGEARAACLAEHGTVAAARSYADDMGFMFCEDCHATPIPLPGFVNGGHQCLTDGTTDAYVLPRY